jgi:hypothetical protein
MMYKVKRCIKAPFMELKYAYQRVTRGFSDRDWWSLDNHIAEILSKALPKYVKDGHGVSTIYYEEGESWDTEIEVLLSRRDPDYLRMAAMFANYDERSDEEMKEMSAWLGKHFGTLWD